MKKWFTHPATGLNEDIKRHREHKLSLEKSIQEIESLENKDEVDQIFLRQFKELYASLMVSYAEVLSKLGKK